MIDVADSCTCMTSCILDGTIYSKARLQTFAAKNGACVTLSRAVVTSLIACSTSTARMALQMRATIIQGNTKYVKLQL